MSNLPSPLLSSRLSPQRGLAVESARNDGGGEPLRLCVLGSGSGGNSAVVSVNGVAMLIDAGLGPRTIAPRLADRGTRVEQIRAICLTHLDQDHFRPTWIATLLRLRLAVFVHRWHVDDLARLPGGSRLAQAGLVNVFEDDPFEPVAGVSVHPVRLAHDTKGTYGFRIDSAGGSLGYATDLGHASRRLIEHFVGVNLLAIESNYDPPMQLQSGRPLFLKRRIMGKAGHLSNGQAFDAVRRIADASASGDPQHIVLLHRSAQCNHRQLVQEMFNQDAGIAGRLTLAEQRHSTPWLAVTPPGTRHEQMRLGF